MTIWPNAMLIRHNLQRSVYTLEQGNWQNVADSLREPMLVRLMTSNNLEGHLWLVPVQVCSENQT